MKTKLIFLFLLTASWGALAGDAQFSIQVAAVKEASKLAFFKESTGFDSLYTEETESGLVRIKLGAYRSREEAEKDLLSIKRKGFPQAFITANTEEPTVKSPIIYSKPHAINEPIKNDRTDPSASPVWSTLTEVQKRNVVYVDGVLHLHEGGKFIPLSSY